MGKHELCVGPLPSWLDHRRLLGPTGAEDPEGEAWQLELGPGGIAARAQLDAADAADLAARLRGLGFEGQTLACGVEPPLRRAQVRRARTEDARRRRATTPGFSRRGTRVDEVGRMSLTPEVLAMRLARWAAERAKRVVDAGCGVGGNAIAFARAGLEVVAIERDRGRLELARHNARVYALVERIDFRHGDAAALAAGLGGPDTILFVDTPWGADWNRRGCGLAELPLLAELLPIARGAGYAALWAKLPPSFRSAELRAKLGADPERLRVEACFGEAEGDRRRVKFLLARADLEPAPAPA